MDLYFSFLFGCDRVLKCHSPLRINHAAECFLRRLSSGRCWRRRAWRWCSTTRWWRIWSPWNAASPCSTSSMAFAPATRRVVFCGAACGGHRLQGFLWFSRVQENPASECFCFGLGASAIYADQLLYTVYLQYNCITVCSEV